MAALIPGLGVQELAIILVIILVLFGPKRLPALGKSLGKTMKAIRDGVDGKDGDGEDEADDKASKDKTDDSDEE
ncbi:MAG: twin-arginine translocase TatA/TatE family subunit [Actinomycetota bacterium]|jgi:sec-independent protein translocase protein TatA|nr:twin-arginine translocase TatA/TatE family subunit [Actinomycetota bacterium]